MATRIGKYEDLRNIPNPQGRLDVAAYRALEHGAKYIEQKHGLSGLWEGVQQYAQEAVQDGLKGVHLPAELEILGRILVHNFTKPKQSGGSGEPRGGEIK